MANAKKRGLGKGLDALLSTQPRIATPSAPGEPVPEGARILQLDPSSLKPNPRQPRRAFDEEALQELAESIRRDGVQEPVIVRKAGGGYELVSGERRCRAAIMADCATIPAVCREVSDSDMLRLGLIENIQREDLNAIELAEGYHALIEEAGCTQEELAGLVGKKRATVTNMLRLLNLPPDVQQHVSTGALSMGHARALLALESAHAQSLAARKIISQGLSVRQAEKLAAPKQLKFKKDNEKDANIAQIEDDLRRSLGTRVSVKNGKDNRGRIEIEYFNLDELDRLLGMLRR